jgi:AcrR family transcriptional regulator
MSTSSTYHHGDLPASLLRAAAEVLEKEGLGALSLREVARRAGVSHNAPYRHFPDREALLAGLAAQGFQMLGERLAANAGRKMGEAYVAFALEHPQRFRLMFGGLVPLARHEALKTSAQRTYQALVSAFQAQPEVADPDKAAAAAWSLVHGLASLLLDGHFVAQKNEGFVRDVLGAVRFASAQRSA